MTIAPGRVSVVINNYNYGRYLGAAIDSGLRQTWSDVEVVVVDDGSTDDSAAVLAGYGDRVVAVEQENQGQSVAVNTGVAHATGEFVVLLDSDDQLLPDLCERVVDTFRAAADLVRVQWPMTMVDADGAPTGEVAPGPPFRLPAGDLARHVARFRTYLWNPTSASAYRRTVLDALLPVPAATYARGTGPDLYLAETVVFLGPVAVLPDAGTLYRVHDASDSLQRLQDVAGHAREKIRETVVGHEQARDVAARLGPPGLTLPADVRAAWDWAFASWRLASLALEPERHPIAGEHRALVGLRGALSIAVHPMYPAKGRVRRALWLLAMGFGPRRLAASLAVRGLTRQPRARRQASRA